MTPHHQLVFDHFQKIKHSNPVLDQITADPIPNTCDEFFARLMHQWNSRNPSWRLNPTGFLIFSKIYHYYQFPLPEQGDLFFQHGRVLVGLHRRLRSPYYWDRKHFYVFDQEIALEIEMVGKDLEHWCSSFLV